MIQDSLTRKVIGCAIEVHRELGPGLLESAYEQALAYELTRVGLPFEKQKGVPISYKEVKLECAYRVDFLIDGKLIVEIKSVERLTGLHEAQILTYMKLAGISTGLLINFNVKLVKQGIKRFVI